MEGNNLKIRRHLYIEFDLLGTDGQSSLKGHQAVFRHCRAIAPVGAKSWIRHILISICQKHNISSCYFT